MAEAMWFTACFVLGIMLVRAGKSLLELRRNVRRWRLYTYLMSLQTTSEQKEWLQGWQGSRCSCGAWGMPFVLTVIDDWGQHTGELCQPHRETIPD